MTAPYHYCVPVQGNIWLTMTAPTVSLERSPVELDATVHCSPEPALLLAVFTSKACQGTFASVMSLLIGQYVQPTVSEAVIAQHNS